jgi:MOSC domain-containing protein YiiM
VEIVSLNVGLPREVAWRGRTVRTGIFKAPVSGSLRARASGLEGDGQADLSVHGGRDKAVYGYPAEHYGYWREALPEAELSWGALGENLTTRGLLEDAVHIGDRFRVGGAELAVTQPRTPCFKLGLRHDRPGLVKQFLRSGRSGFYFAVLVEGAVEAGDRIERIDLDERRLSVADCVRLARGKGDRDLLRAAAAHPALADAWQTQLREELGRREG